ncbi:MAG TPA: ABC transporter permease [Anaerolineales bacterium]|nr:ABC transporter permease [Anaerolineales bacterium]HNA89844.1 ABC transporter permease [Anaerolineales bacterium]HNB36567.1 ABC transporter permease [Anaerolineales bacterium]HNC08583.1 ABC transporter permease [Anaerolineales bacterium]
MSATTRVSSDDLVIRKKFLNSSFMRMTRYVVFRLLTLFITVVIGVYLTILIANMGGFVDKIIRGQIRDSITQSIAASPTSQTLSSEDRKKLIEERIALEEKRRGLDTPIAVRNARYLVNALQLDLGRAINMTSDSGSKQVRLILLERLPATMLLMGTSQLFLFFSSLFIALNLSRHYGSFWDKLVITLSPSSAIPPWFYGIFLILIFAAGFKILPFGGMVDSPPPTNTINYALSVLKHLALPGLSLIISSFFSSIYNYRTFFLIYSSEDYVDMARAKGLHPKDIERRYILRPTLPNIITNFSLLIIGLWTGALFTETVFLWPGLGRTLFQAIGFYDTPIIVGSTVIYAYLLAMTVFILNFVYALVDPRVKIGE